MKEREQMEARIHDLISSLEDRAGEIPRDLESLGTLVYQEMLTLKKERDEAIETMREVVRERIMAQSNDYDSMQEMGRQLASAHSEVADLKTKLDVLRDEIAMCDCGDPIKRSKKRLVTRPRCHECAGLDHSEIDRLVLKCKRLEKDMKRLERDMDRLHDGVSAYRDVVDRMHLSWRRTRGTSECKCEACAWERDNMDLADGNGNEA